MSDSMVYPFGRPVTVRPPSASTARPLFVLGAYPSALHVRWKPHDQRLVRAIPVDDEPEPFWDGADAEHRLSHWLTTLDDPDAFGAFSVPEGLNGPSGRWVTERILDPLGANRETAWITDCLDTYRMSDGVAKVITDVYEPSGLPPCRLSKHPSENEIVSESLEHHRERLLHELATCAPDRVVTLGNAAARVFAVLVGLAQRKLSIIGYGAPVEVRLAGRVVSWFPLAHPAAPRQYQDAHRSWLDTLR